jgi:hypothetical protein
MQGREQISLANITIPQRGKGAHLIMTEKRPFEHPVPPERCWLKYQLNLCNIKYAAIAKVALRTEAFVSLVVCGKRRSKIVEAVLADILGYPSWEKLWAAALVNTERRTA